MKCAVSGGTGFIGRRIVDRLLRDSHYVGVWSRRPGLEKRTGVASYIWDPLAGEPPAESVNTMDAIIHLAGESVAQRWNAEVKRRIRDSRVLGTRRLVDAIARVRHKPKVLVSASAIGYYGDRGDEELTESAQPGSGFLAEVCQAWEAEADRAAESGLRVVKLRIGFVLGRDGGALARLAPLFRAFAGGRLGSGRQWMPWIHVDDVAELVCRIVRHGSTGTLNAVTGEVASFRELAEFTADQFSPRVSVTTSPRSGPMPHGGFRPFDPAAIRKAFPDFKATPWRTGVAAVCKALEMAEGS